MKAEELYKGVIEIDDRFIEEAQETKRNGKHYAWKRYAAAAACLCLIAASAIIVAGTGSNGDLHIVLFRSQRGS